MAQQRQRLASRAYSLLDFGQRLGAAPDHADVLRGRSADSTVPDPAHGAERGRDPPAHRRARPQQRRAARQPRLPLRHRAARRARNVVREPGARRAVDAAGVTSW